MKSCSTCGTQVNDKATTCPTCGEPLGNPTIPANNTNTEAESNASATNAKPAKKKGKTLKIILIVIATLILLSAISSCSKSCSPMQSNKSEDWPTGPLAQMIPSMNKKCAYVNESKTSLSIRIEQGITKNDYSNYVKKCKEWGYTVEVDEQSNEYKAFNEEGYKLEVDFHDYSKNEIYISLTVPRGIGDLVWPTMGLATTIPNPNKNQGEVDINSTSQLLVYVGNITESEYRTYIDRCIASGYDIDYNRGTKVYTAKNSVGDSLRVEYRGFNTMSVSIYATKDSDSITSSSGNTDTAGPSQTSNQSNTPDSSFKQTMDDYEKFIDDYIAFMKKYESSSDTSSMTKDYMKMLSDYRAMVQKIDSIDESSLSEADRKYYTEVNARVAKKLSDALLE